VTPALLAGMPRSGSTLLRGILSQNPELAVTPYSGLSDVLASTLASWQNEPHQAFPRHDALDRVMASIVRSYHPEGKVAVDLSRDWPVMIPEIERATGEEARIVCMVRDPVEVFASCEKLHRDQPYDRWNRIAHGRTVEERVALMEQSFVGLGYRALVSAFDSGHGDRLLFVDYHRFLADPERELNRIYSHWRMSYYPHTFSDVRPAERENDAMHGPRDLHTVKPTLEKPTYGPEDVLGKRLTEHLKRTYPAFWTKWI
jgi:sulfotransferase